MCNTGVSLSPTNYFIALAASFLQWSNAVCHKEDEIYSQPQLNLPLGYMDGQGLIIKICNTNTHNVGNFSPLLDLASR